VSFHATTWAIDQACETATEKAVLLVVASYAGADGACFPSQDTIARQACCSVKSVERALATFETRGWITRQHRQRRDGSRTSDLIHLTLSANPEAREIQSDTVSHRPNPTRQGVRSNPTPCPIQPDTVSGLTTFEPVTEPVNEPTPPNPPLGGDLFSEVLGSYPKAGLSASGPDKARAAWATACTLAKPAVILAAIRAYAASEVVKTGGTGRVPSLPRWLNERRWETWETTGPLAGAALASRTPINIAARLALLESLN